MQGGCPRVLHGKVGVVQRETASLSAFKGGHGVGFWRPMGCMSVWMGGVLCVGTVGWMKLAVWAPHVGPCVFRQI